MRVAVTGGTGFIGTRVVQQLVDAGHEVVCVVRTPEKAGALSAMGATLKKGDILDRASLLAAFEGAEGVMHLAASYELGVTGKKAQEAIRKNLDGTRIALEAARDAGAKKIVYTSSIVVYGTTRGAVVDESHAPDTFFPSVYAKSKSQAHFDIAVPMQKAGVPIIIVQPGGVIGPRDHSTYRVLFRMLARGLPATIGGARYGIVDVEDCARGHVLALEKGRPGESYHLVSENLALPDLARLAASSSGLGGTVIVLPDALLSLNAPFMGLLEKFLPVPDFLSSETLRSVRADLTMTVKNDKARAELGWEPRPLAHMLREIMKDELTRMGKPLPAQLSA